VVDYSLFVCFFPLLVAGPIERATHLLPQVQRPRSFDYYKAADGLRQILWGLFKKAVIADNCAVRVNEIFGHYESYGGITLVMGAVLFAFQIYGDFSGYTDMALGSARLMGFELLQNFNYPYFSRSIAEFWRRWHISLSSWFRDYLYIPLGGNKGSVWLRIRNTFIIFIVSGFWHGAKWTFIAWGLINALLIIPSIIKKTNRNNLDIVAANTLLPSLKEFMAITSTFLLACFAWIFFRAESISQALGYVKRLFAGAFFHKPGFKTYDNFLLGLLLFFILVEWQGRKHKFALQNVSLIPYKPIRWGIYASIIFLIGMYMQTKESPFIYFQF
jgi:D-alanyl-lipoteichoic acid acyltransferase DltB (MBOAT superfamily)